LPDALPAHPILLKDAILLDDAILAILKVMYNNDLRGKRK
jgi:hypothetical protein